MRIRTMQWVVEWDGRQLHVMPLLAVEGRNREMLRTGGVVGRRNWKLEIGKLEFPVVLGVYGTEKDAKTARRLIEQEEDVGRWRESGEGTDRTDRTDRTV